MSRVESQDWQERGREPMTRQQQKLLNAACGDLATSLRWHGHRFDKDDFRLLICAVVLGERLVPGINTGMGAPGLVRMGRSSKELTKTQATEAIRMAFDIGDNPEDQGIDAPPVRWGPAVCYARWVSTDTPDYTVAA
ncbi:recombination protein NinB [Lysobacter olei]